MSSNYDYLDLLRTADGLLSKSIDTMNRLKVQLDEMPEMAHGLALFVADIRDAVASINVDSGALLEAQMQMSNAEHALLDEAGKLGLILDELDERTVRPALNEAGRRIRAYIAQVSG